MITRTRLRPEEERVSPLQQAVTTALEDMKAVNVSLLVLLFACMGYAAPGGTITGIIKAPDGAPFRAGFVRAENTKTKVTTMVLSNNQGSM